MPDATTTPSSRHHHATIQHLPEEKYIMAMMEAPLESMTEPDLTSVESSRPYMDPRALQTACTRTQGRYLEDGCNATIGEPCRSQLLGVLPINSEGKIYLRFHRAR